MYYSSFMYIMKYLAVYEGVMYYSEEPTMSNAPMGNVNGCDRQWLGVMHPLVRGSGQLMISW